MEHEETKGFLSKLVKACPALPYMALGMWLAWAFIQASGTAWLSDTEINGANISTLFITSSGTMGIVLLLSACFVSRVKRMLQKPRWILGSAAISSLGCLLVILAGPYYLSAILPYSFVRVLFYCGSAVGGAGMSLVVLKCAELYSSLPPRRVVLYVALSHVVVGATYFIVIGAPPWAPMAGGPSLAGIVAFVGLPLLVGAFLFLSFYTESDHAKASHIDNKRRLSKPFWKLFSVVLVFSLVVMAVRAVVVQVSPVDVTFASTRIVMLLRMLMAVIFACAAIGVNAQRFNFGKLYSVIMAAAVVFISFMPIVGALHTAWSLIIAFVGTIFEFVLWCILAFVVFQKRISIVLVFGLAYGGYLLGSSIGWAIGAGAFMQIVGASNAFVLYLVLAFVVLACAFILFSEKEFDNLFKPEDESEASLKDLLCQSLAEEASNSLNPDGQTEKKGKFNAAIKNIAEQYHLSNREIDVLRCLAMGYNSSATAKNLQVSWNTVRTHTHNVYGKLDVHSRQELIELVNAVTNATTNTTIGHP